MITCSPAPRRSAGRVAAAAAAAIIAVLAPAMAQQPPAPRAAAPQQQPPTAAQTPSETFAALTPTERRAMQSDLAWTGKFNGLINGEPSERIVNAIKSWQKDRNSQQTGVLNPKERTQLSEVAKQRQTAVGWRLIPDAPSGSRLGVPLKLAPKYSSDASTSRWAAPNGAVEIMLSRRDEPEPSTARLAEAERANPAGRKIEYNLVRPDFFVLSGLQGARKFYLRGTFSGRQVRILTVTYDPAQDALMQPVIIAMSSAFTPFPATAAVAAKRKPVDYGTGLVVSGDTVITDRALADGCTSLVIAGHGNAEGIADDKATGLALLRLYGASGLTPFSLATGPAPQTVDLLGIADPQNQGGGHAVSRSPASVAANRSLTPAPGLGFSGAVALDQTGRFSGIALMKTQLVAGPADGTAANEATLAPPDAVSAFLRSQNIASPAQASKDPAASVVRVICVRK